MAKILALDVGEKRIGLATTDELEIIASPVGFIERKNAITILVDFIDKEKIEKIVIGSPNLKSGDPGSQHHDVNKFADELAQNVKLPTEFENEFLTSSEAQRRLNEMGEKYEKGDIDAIAATIILESYLRRKDHAK